MKLKIQIQHKYNIFNLTVLSMQSTIAQNEKPKVLLITIDDLNDWVGNLQGYPKVLTPHMDRLAAWKSKYLFCSKILSLDIFIGFLMKKK